MVLRALGAVDEVRPVGVRHGYGHVNRRAWARATDLKLNR